MTLSLAVAGTNLATLDTPLLVVALPSAPTLDPALGPIDASTGGAISRAIGRRDFRGGRDETLHFAGAESRVQRVLLVGMGPATDRRRDYARHRPP